MQHTQHISIHSKYDDHSQRKMFYLQCMLLSKEILVSIHCKQSTVSITHLVLIKYESKVKERRENNKFQWFRKAFTRKVPKIMAIESSWEKQKTDRDQWTKFNWISICWNDSKEDFIVLLFWVRFTLLMCELSARARMYGVYVILKKQKCQIQ